MSFTLYLTDEANATIAQLKADSSQKKRYKAICKTLGYLASNPKHPSLQTHEYSLFSRQLGQKVFEAYAENRTPGAWRIFWYYGPKEGAITVLYITPHP